MGIESEMAAKQNPRPDADAAGLCARCKQVRRVRTDRGSVFYLCRRSSTDPSYPQYPRLPVLFCRGYEAQEPDPVAEAGRAE